VDTFAEKRRNYGINLAVIEMNADEASKVLEPESTPSIDTEDWVFIGR
jgi:hypothetical protein